MAIRLLWVPPRPRVIILGADDADAPARRGLALRIDNRSRGTIRHLTAWAERGESRLPADPESVAATPQHAPPRSRQTVLIDENAAGDLRGCRVYLSYDYRGWTWLTVQQPDGAQRTEPVARIGFYHLSVAQRRPETESTPFSRRRWRASRTSFPTDPGAGQHRA